jgi:hypothetical protein
MSIADTVYVGSATAIFYDIVILVLPIPLLLGLQMNNRKKVGLIGLFFLGAFTTVCSIMRLTQVKSIISGADVTGLILWGVVEMNVGVGCKPNPLMPRCSRYLGYSHLPPHSLTSLQVLPRQDRHL